MMSCEPFIGIEEAALILLCSKKTVYKLTNQRTIKHYKRHGKLLFRKSELIEYLEDGKINTTFELEQIARKYKREQEERRARISS